MMLYVLTKKVFTISFKCFYISCGFFMNNQIGKNFHKALCG